MPLADVTVIRKQGISKSKWISALIREKTVSTWPETVSELADAWADMPTAEEIREKVGRGKRRRPHKSTGL
jgi:hypothetical protein